MKVGALAAALLPLPALAASPPERLGPGVLLYAAPALEDPNFVQTVLLLVEHSEGGAMGLVLNRPTDLLLRELLPEVEELRGVQLPLHWGGPVRLEAVFALVRAPTAPEGAVTVTKEVHLVGDIGPLKAALREPDAGRRLRLFAGCAGWSAGQLEGEIRRGYWVLDPADAESVFVPDPSRLWPRVFRILRRLQARGPGPPGLSTRGGP